MKAMSWPLALAVLGALAALVALVAMKADTGDIVLIILVLLGAAGGSQLGAVKQQTNGTMTTVLAEMAEARREQAQLIRELAGKRPAEIAAEPRSDPGVGDRMDGTG